MKQQTRMPRRVFIKGLASSAGVLLAGCTPTDPPTYGHVLRMGDLLTYKAHRLLLPAHSLAREYDYSDISSVPAIGTTNPADPEVSSGHGRLSATPRQSICRLATGGRRQRDTAARLLAG